MLKTYKMAVWSTNLVLSGESALWSMKRRALTTLAAAGAGVLVGAAATLAAPALRDRLKPKWSHPLGMHE